MCVRVRVRVRVRVYLCVCVYIREVSCMGGVWWGVEGSMGNNWLMRRLGKG